MNEYDTAIRRFREGKEAIRPRIERYIDLLLTPQPIMYLRPALAKYIDLSRLTRVYQWKDPSVDENAVFEKLREDWFCRLDFDEWVEALPSPIIEKTEIKKGLFGIKEEGKREVISRLPKVFDEMESMIETNQRFESYELEIKAIDKLGISFSEWLNFAEYDPMCAESNVLCIIPKEPIKIDF